MPGRVPGSKKCADCGWIHVVGGEHRDPKPGSLLAKQAEDEAVIEQGPEPMVLQHQSSRADVDMRTVLNRLAYLEARMALLEARISKPEP